MESLIHYHKCLHVLTLLVLGLFAVGASAQGAEAKIRGKAPQGQDYLTSVTEANVEAVGLATRTERVQGDAALAVSPQHHVSAPGGSGRDTGACCFPDGSCDDTFTSQSSCEDPPINGDWQGFGTDCDPNCCLQPFTGGDDCDTAFVHNIVVPPFGAPAVTVTISGNNSAVTTGVCDMSGTDPGWYEAFNLIDGAGDPAPCARVTIDKCCTDPEPGADYIIIIRGCSEANINCGANVFSDDYGWAPFCGGDDSNLWNLFYGLPGGTYHYPIMSDDTTYPGCLGPYQVHITVESCEEIACCLPGDPYCDFPGDDQPPLNDGCVVTTLDDCYDRNGFPHEDVFDCEQACLSACCLPGGVCYDNDGAGIDCPDCVALGGEWAVNEFYGGGLRCYDNPCPVCPWYPSQADDYCIEDDQGDYMVHVDRSATEPGEPYPRWADDFIADGNGQIQRICWWPCFYDPYTPQECYLDPIIMGVVDNAWQIVFYADDNGVPGAIVGGPEMVAPDLKAPRSPISRCWEYTAPLADGPIVTQGECYWIEITGLGAPYGCQVYWLTSCGGNKYSLRDNDGDWGPEDVVFVVGGGTAEAPYSDCIDTTFCVDVGMQPGACGDIPGACYVCGEEGVECDPEDITHNDCREPWGPFEKPACIAFFPYWDCDTGWCNDGVTLCSISEQDCPPGLEPCTGPLWWWWPRNDNCDTDGNGTPDGATDLHDQNPEDPCPTLPCTFDFDNTCANTDGPDPECGTDFGADIWFEFHAQAGECGNLYIDTCTGGTYDGIIAFYGTPTWGVSGCPTDSTEMVSCGDDTCGVGGGMPCIGDDNPAHPFCPEATDEIYVCENMSYLIRMGGWAGDYGSGQMTISFVADPAGCYTLPCSYNKSALRPLAEDCAYVDGVLPTTRCSASFTCTTDTDCANESHCSPPPTDQPELGYVCYAPKLRYISIARNPEQWSYTARRIKLDDGTMLGWVGTPWEHTSSGEWFADLVNVPVYVGTWPDVVHVEGCEIAHANLSDITEVHVGPNPAPPGEVAVHHCYIIQAIWASDDTGNEDDYSEALTLCTNSTWGDTVTTGPGGLIVPPDGVPSLADIMAAIVYFQGQTVAPMTWLDIAPSGGSDTPDQHVGLGDIMGCTGGFQGEPYPGVGPLACP